MLKLFLVLVLQSRLDEESFLGAYWYYVEKVSLTYCHKPFNSKLDEDVDAFEVPETTKLFAIPYYLVNIFYDFLSNTNSDASLQTNFFFFSFFFPPKGKHL